MRIYIENPEDPDDLYSIPATRAAVEVAEALGWLPVSVEDMRRMDLVMGREPLL